MRIDDVAASPVIGPCHFDLALSAVGHAWRVSLFFLALVVAGVGGLGLARAADPLPVAGRIGPSSGTVTLLLDPVSCAPGALLSDPFRRLPTELRGAVLETSDESTSSAGLARLVVADSLPEFWAQPAVWENFLKGPAAFSGFGRELRSRDWAGRMATDRRAYALDPGLKSSSTPLAVAPAGAGLLTPGLSRTGFVLRWSGVAGRVYHLQYAATLARGFQDLQTIIPGEDGSLTVTLPLSGGEGFYRVTEIQP